MTQLAPHEVVQDRDTTDDLAAPARLSEAALRHQRGSDQIVRASDYVKQRQWSQAVRILETVLQEQPLRYEAWTELAAAFKHLGLRQEAKRCYWRVTEIVPDTWPCWHNLLVHYCEDKASTDELESLIRAHAAAASLMPLDAWPATRAEPYVRLADLLLMHQQPQLAEGPARLALTVHHALPAMVVLATSLSEQKCTSAALPMWQMVLTQAQTQLQAGSSASPAFTVTPQKVATWRAYYALCLFDAGQITASKRAYEQAINDHPLLHVAMSNLSYLFETLGDAHKARYWLQRAIAVQPDYAAHRFKAACYALQDGDLRRGFAEYESRLAMYVPGSLKYENVFALQQKGVPLCRSNEHLRALRGKRVFIYPEQGYGDFFQYVRFFAQLLAYQCADLSYFTFPSLVRYAQSLHLPAPLNLVLSVDHSGIDAYIPMMSLPALLGHQSFADIPAPLAPQWQADTRWQRVGQQAALRIASVQTPDHAPLLGFSWRGNAEHEMDRWRSIPLDLWLRGVVQPLLRAGLRLLSLQHDASEAERRQLQALGVASLQDLTTLPPEPLDLGDDSRTDDWLFTAAVVAQLSGVIAVDTALIHLSASMAVPTWLLNRHDALSDWRWLRERRDSPWYPSLTILRQTQAGKWQSVFAAAVQAVRAQLQR